MIVPGRALSVDGHGGVHYGAMLAGPVDEAVLEVAAPPAGYRRVVLVASRIADRAAFEAVPRPGITDGAVYLVCCRRRRPVDRGHRIADQLHGTEVVEAAAPVRAAGLVGDRITELLTAQGKPLGRDPAVELEGTELGMPDDELAARERLRPAHAVERGPFDVFRLAESPGSAQRVPLLRNRADYIGHDRSSPHPGLQAGGVPPGPRVICCYYGGREGEN